MTVRHLDSSTFVPGDPPADLGLPTQAGDGITSPVPAWKRVLDLSLGTVALVLLAPVMVLAACAIRLSSPGPALFRQTRIGCDERPFSFFKFRTMYQDSRGDTEADRAAIARELSGEAIPEGDLFRPAEDSRVTPVGRLLRKFSIDELPQLFNVLRGEMSLVGPRPAVPWEVELFSEEQRRRHCVLPGVTGLWQVSGRNRCTTRDMLELDLTYAEQCSLKLDLSILLRTPAAVLFDRYTR